MEKQKRLSQDSSDKRFRRDSSHEKSPKKLPSRVKSDGLGEDEGTSTQKRKSRGSTLSPKFSHSSPTGVTPVGSPQSSRSGSIDHGKADGIQTSRPGTPTISTPLTNRNNSPVSGDINNLDEFDPKDPYKNGTKPSKGEGSSKDHDQEEEEEENEEQVANEEYKLQVKNSGRTNEELRSLIEAFSTEQLRRYEVFRRSSLNKANTRLLLSSILSQQTTQNLAMIVAGFSKVFVGEIVELALDVKKEWDSKASTSSSGDPQSELVSSSAPLQPHHLREAYRRYLKQNTVISGPRGPIAPATTAHHNGVPSIVSRPRRFFKR